MLVVPHYINDFVSVSLLLLKLSHFSLKGIKVFKLGDNITIRSSIPSTPKKKRRRRRRRPKTPSLGGAAREAARSGRRRRAASTAHRCRKR